MRTMWSIANRLAAAAALLACLLTGAARAEDLTVRIGYASIGAGNRPFVGGTLAATAHAAHYVEDELKSDHGVKIEWFFFAGAGPAVNEAFANGQLDIALQGDLPSVIGRANGLRTKILLASGVNTPIYLAVPPDSDIKTVADLKGRRVALYRGTNLQLAFDKVLASKGFSEHDLKIINMDAATADAALASHDVDAAVGANELFELQKNGIVKIVYSTKGDDPAFGRNSALIAAASFEEAHPDITQKIVTAFVRAALWSSDEANRDALFELWAKSGYPADSFRADFEGQPLKFRNSPLIDPFIVHQYEVQAQQARAYKLLRKDVDLTGWFEPKYVETALRQLGLEHRWTARDANGHDLGS